MRGHGRERGFSLFELLVTVTLLTITLAIAAPSFAGLHQGVQLEAATRDLVSLANLARATACTRGEPVELWVPAEGRLARLRRAERTQVVRSSGIASIDRLFAPPGDAASSSASVPASASELGLASAQRPLPAAVLCADVTPGAGSPEVRLVFHPDGTARAARVRLATPEGRERFLRVQAIDGAVRVEAAP